jgi:hypothetical protein
VIPAAAANAAAIAAMRMILVGLPDIDAELGQFAMDARRAPQRVGSAHPADQVADFGTRLGSSRTA